MLGGLRLGACLSFLPVALVARVYSRPLADHAKGSDHWRTLGQGFHPPLCISYLGTSILFFTAHYGTSKERFKYMSAYSSCQGRNVDLHTLEGSSPGKVEKCKVDWLNSSTELTQMRSLVTQMYWLPCGRLLQAARKQGLVTVVFTIGVFSLNCESNP